MESMPGKKPDFTHTTSKRDTRSVSRNPGRIPGTFRYLNRHRFLRMKFFPKRLVLFAVSPVPCH